MQVYPECRRYQTSIRVQGSINNSTHSVDQITVAPERREEEEEEIGYTVEKKKGLRKFYNNERLKIHRHS